MPLYVFNLSVNPVVLAVVTPAKTIPASAAVGQRGAPVNVTTDLRGLTSANYVTLQAQVAAGALVYEWTNGYAEYGTEALEVVRAPAGNLYLPADPVRSVVTIYARSTGNDATGDGKTVGTAYRTFVRALRDVPLVIRGTNYVVDITDLGTENLPSWWRMPCFSGDSITTTDLAPPYPMYNVLNALTVRAGLSLDSTVPAANIVSQTANPTTGLYTVVTNLALVPHALRGKIALYYVIVDNTATDIEIASTGALPAGDIQIFAQSATLNQADAAVYYPVVTLSGSAGVHFYGISFQTESVSSNSCGLFVASTSCDRVVNIARYCSFDGIFVSAGSFFWALNSYITRRLGLYGQGSMVMSCLVHSAEWSDPQGTQKFSVCEYDYSVFDGCVSIGTAFRYSNFYTGSTYMVSCDIRNSTSNGVSLYGGSHRVEHCYIHNNVGVGVLLDGAKTSMHACLIKDNGGNGITAKNMSFIQADTVTGTGNTGYGLQISSGSQVSAATSCTITGTVNAVKVGDNAAGAWPVAGNYTDVAADKVEFARLLTY